MTLLNSRAKTFGSGAGLELAAILKSGFKGDDRLPAAEHRKDANVFERWCREQGLLIEINDADYAEPKLAVVS